MPVRELSGTLLGASWEGVREAVWGRPGDVLGDVRKCLPDAPEVPSGAETGRFRLRKAENGRFGRFGPNPGRSTIDG